MSCLLKPFWLNQGNNCVIDRVSGWCVCVCVCVCVSGWCVCVCFLAQAILARVCEGGVAPVCSLVPASASPEVFSCPEIFPCTMPWLQCAKWPGGSKVCTSAPTVRAHSRVPLAMAPSYTCFTHLVQDENTTHSGSSGFSVGKRQSERSPAQSPPLGVPNLAG